MGIFGSPSWEGIEWAETRVLLTLPRTGQPRDKKRYEHMMSGVLKARALLYGASDWCSYLRYLCYLNTQSLACKRNSLE